MILAGVVIMYLRVKRVIDFVLSLVGLILLSPIFLLIILAIKLESRGSVFFKLELSN